MKLKALILNLSIFSLLILASNSYGHGDGHKPVDQAKATKIATQVVANLVDKKILEKSWTATTASSVDQKEFQQGIEWVAVFVNNKITDTSKQKLYVFLTLGGDYIAANHTGK